MNGSDAREEIEWFSFITHYILGGGVKVANLDRDGTFILYSGT